MRFIEVLLVNVTVCWGGRVQPGSLGNTPLLARPLQIAFAAFYISKHMPHLERGVKRPQLPIQSGVS